MGSTRLPGKTLLPLAGTTLIGCVLHRLTRVARAELIVVATTELGEDDTLVDYCRNQGIRSFRGSATNVLERYCRCAQAFQLEHVVRLTGDNPFVDAREVDRLIDEHLGTGNDFTSSFESLPIGVGAEIFRTATLLESLARATEPHQLEHADEYVLEHRAHFKTSVLHAPPAKRHPDIRLTVDTRDDYERAVRLVDLAGIDITTEQAIAACSQSA